MHGQIEIADSCESVFKCITNHEQADQIFSNVNSSAVVAQVCKPQSACMHCQRMRPRDSSVLHLKHLLSKYSERLARFVAARECVQS